MGKDPACTSYSLFPIIHAAGHRLQQGGGAPTSDPRVHRHAKRKMIFPAVSRPLTAAFFSRARHRIALLALPQRNFQKNLDSFLLVPYNIYC